MKIKRIAILCVTVFGLWGVYLLLHNKLNSPIAKDVFVRHMAYESHASQGVNYPTNERPGNTQSHNNQYTSKNNRNVLERAKLSPYINIVEWNQSMPRPVNCPHMLVKPNFTVCVHEPLDKWSKRLLENRLYEMDTTSALNKMLTTYPEASFIDIGSHVGYFSHLAMARGRKVVAVDLLERNVRPLLWAAKLNGRQAQVTMLLNGVSDNNTELVITTHKNAWDMTFIGQMSDKDETWLHDREKHILGRLTSGSAVKTITLNDLASVITTPVTVMKIDVEGHECSAFNEPTSSMLFSQVFIPYIIMEWRFRVHATRIPSACSLEGVVILQNYLTTLGYHPYAWSHGKKRLSAANTNGDISKNVFWVHSKAKDFVSA